MARHLTRGTFRRLRKRRVSTSQVSPLAFIAIAEKTPMLSTLSGNPTAGYSKTRAMKA